MTYEYSCGAVVFTRIDGCPTICWSGRRISRRAATAFPRATWGRRDGTGTALREIFEETGVRLTLLEGFRAVTEYALPIPDTWKRVVFFLGEYEYQTVRVQESELASFAPVPFDEALELTEFADSRQIHTDAHAFLTT